MKGNFKDTRYMQYIAVLTASLTTASVGMSSAWSSPTLSKFQSESSPVGTKLSDEALSWVVSSQLLAALPGAFIARWAVDYLGRKPTLLLSGVLLVVHWLFLLFANSLALLLIGRILLGIATGILIPTSIIYAAEVSDDDIRGKLLSYAMLSKTLGAVTVLVVGPYVSYTTLGVLCASAPLIFVVVFIFMPESPFYYSKVRKEAEAMRSLIRLSKKDFEDNYIEEKLLFIQETVQDHMKNKGSFTELLTNKTCRWILFLMLGIQTLQQFNGNMALEFYIQPIIESANNGLNPKIASIIIGCIQIPSVLLSGILVDRIGRKPLLITSTIFCGIALLGEGTYFFIQDYLRGDTSRIGWLPTAGLALFWVMNSMGMSTVPYILLGELYPTNVKGAGVTIATIYGNSSGFIVSKFFKPLSNVIGIYSIFYIFASTCVIGVFFVYFFLPETKGKNFQEIQEVLNRRRKKLGYYIT